MSPRTFTCLTFRILPTHHPHGGRVLPVSNKPNLRDSCCQLGGSEYELCVGSRPLSRATTRRNTRWARSKYLYSSASPYKVLNDYKTGPTGGAYCRLCSSRPAQPLVREAWVIYANSHPQTRIDTQTKQTLSMLWFGSRLPAVSSSKLCTQSGPKKR